ncbi:MAG TPA: RICIN domain-containing protein, partial [Verrucomicrobiae bacterium]|nr:RICIN domain-containing protein [Verrucomicrobiae bacterium]
FVYTDGGAPQPYDSFVATNAHLSGVINSGFISGGTNVLSVVINNTGTGTLGPDVAPTNTATHHDATVLGLSGAISYFGPQIFSGTYELVNANSGLVLEVRSQATTNGANVDQWEENGGANQQWTLTSLGNGLYQIINVNSGLALEVSGSATNNGANVDQWTMSGGSNQEWSLTSLGHGLHQIINANSGLALEVSGGGITNGINVDQSSWVGSANQQWWILPVVTTVPAGTVTPTSGGSGAPATTFHGFNWSDYNKFPDLLAGITITDTYSSVESKTSMVLSRFANVGANCIRISFMPQTVLGTWWPTFRGTIDEATSMGMKVIFVASNNNGKAFDLTTFWQTWDMVVTSYNGNSNVYFEILNEPYGYSTGAWMGIVTNWLNRYPTVAHGGVFVGGSGYDADVPAVASSPAVNDCLFSVHDYGFWNSYTNDAAYYNHLSCEIGSYAGSTVLTEYGYIMSPNINYAAGDQHNTGIESVIGFCNYCYSNHLGSLYYTGLAETTGYTMFSLETNQDPNSMALQCPSGMNLVQYGWGVAVPPATPAGLTAMAGESQVVLNWSAANGATGYNLKRSLTSGGNYTVIATNFPGLAFTNSGLSDGTMYYYVVSAANVAGESADSAPIGVIPLSGVPANIFATFGNGQFQISWPWDHIGWLLQAQTNSPPNGLGTNWVTLPGSGGTNQISVPFSLLNGSVFFRLAHP